MTRGAWIAFLVVAVTTSSGAQVVRGRVTETGNAAPVAGALVSLSGVASDDAITSVLTNVSGEYALRAPGAGQYRLAVKRIGVRRFVSPAFDIRSGETRVIDVPIDAIALTLPQVTVSGLCALRSRDLARIASLWDEARTALEAAEISMRDSLSQTRITRYAAELEPSLRVLFDWRSDAAVVSGEPYTSVTGDSLSAMGYWHALPGDSVEFLAPDAKALTSNAFLRDHCFGLAPAPRTRRDLVGLSFQPSRDRTLPDISGTIWLDARQFELRYIEFRYTRLGGTPNADRVGGEVYFSRLTSGAWIVERWFIRMPQVITVEEAWPRQQLREEGGAVVVEGAVAPSPVATVSGVVRDTSGRPLSGATVRALGTHRQVMSGPDGSYRLDSVPATTLNIVVHTEAYDSHAALADRRRVPLNPGQRMRLDLRAANGNALRQEFCPVTSPTSPGRRRVRSVLRLLMVDSATTTPLSGIRFMVSWPMNAEMQGEMGNSELNRQAMSDQRGAATFCDLPAGVPLEVSVMGNDGARGHVMMLELPRNGFTSRVVMGRVTSSP